MIRTFLKWHWVIQNIEILLAQKLTIYLIGMQIGQLNYYLFVYSAYIIVRANHPEIFQRVRVYPLEDENLRVEAVDQQSDFKNWHRLVWQNPHITPDQYSDTFSFLNEHFIPEPLLIPESEIEDFSKRLGVSENARINIRMLMRAQNDIVSLVLRRDAAVVQSVLNLPGNGLIIFGEGHSHGIKRGLIEARRDENGSL